MRDIFRKSALDKISSPDQLDQVIVITPPGFFIAMLGAGIMLLTVLVWSVFGRIPVTIKANGIYMTNGGIHVIYSENGGMVEEILVSDGDTVERNDVIVRLSAEELHEKLLRAETRKKEAEAVTIDSKGDIENADTKNLLDLKAELLTLRSTLTADEQMLAMRKNELEKLQAEANAAQAKMQSARSMFYGYMTTDSTTPEQLVYQDAQTTLNSAKSNYESAKNQLASFNAANNDTLDYLKERIERLEEQRDGLDVSSQKYEEEKRTIEEEIYKLANQRDTIYSQKGAYEQAFYEWEQKLNMAQNNYYNSAFAYLNKESTELHKKTFDAQLTDDYNVALSNYNTALSRLRSAEDAVAQLTVQTASEQSNVTVKYESLTRQFDAARGAVLADIEKEIKELSMQLDKTEIRAGTGGYVTGLSVAAGNVIGQGSVVCRIVEERFTASKADDTVQLAGQKGIASQMAAILYVPLDQGKKIRAGMDVKVYPSTAKKEEYGHINAFVTSVSDYVASAEEIRNGLGEDSLVQNFTKAGPIVQVNCFLKRDGTTKSGYDWSSKKGAQIELTPGTIVTADIVSETKAPITMLIPLLREKLTVKTDGTSEENK
ncbi:MAG TPA: hypothetical protein DCW47_01640 [Lachnospiraceae bacterium]|nr:hypothetical protein [Lachnospiraceae bacterium]